MRKQPFVNIVLAGVNLTEFGLLIPSPFSSLEIENSEIASATSWKLTCVVGGDDTRKVNVAAFEALLYSAAQKAAGYKNASGIPVSFAYGWIDSSGQIEQHTSYQGFTLKFNVSASGQYMVYKLEGYASLAIQSNVPALRIPALCGFVQPSAVAEALAIGVKATSYYDLDIDHNDAPTLVQHGALTTSFNKYVRGSYTGKDDYEQFPGLLKLSKSYNGSRDAAGLMPGIRSVRQVLDNATCTPIGNFLKKAITDLTPQCASFSYWVDEPTMTAPGVIHYKSNASLATSQLSDVLEYGTANSNVISLSGSYNGVAYSMTDMNFTQVGFVLDGSGNTIVQNAEVVNSWSSSLAGVFQTANIINDVNALASQFSGDFTIEVPGDTKQFKLAQPISLLVMMGNTLSPITGIYSVMSVSHSISATFITRLKVQRLVMSSANQTAAGQGIFIRGSGAYSNNSYAPTNNILSTGKVDFGKLWPNFENIGNLSLFGV